MTAGDVALVIGAVAGLVTAVGTLVSSWQRKAARDADALEKERNELRVQVEAARRHIHALAVLLADHGIRAPALPAALRQKDEGKDS